MRFSLEALLTLAVRGSSLALMGATSILIARQLGPAGQGAVATVAATVMMLVSFGNLGVYGANIRMVAEKRDLLAAAAGNSLILAAVLGAGLFALTALLAGGAPSLLADVPPRLLLTYAAAIPFALATMFFQGLALAAKRVKAYNALVLARSLLVFLLVGFVLFAAGGTPGRVLAALAAAEAAVAALYVVVVYRIQRFAPRIDSALLRRMVGYSARIYLAWQLTYLVLRSDILVVNYLLGSHQAGVYSAASKLADLLYMVPDTVLIVFFPAASALPAATARAFARRVGVTMAAVMAVACGGVYLLSPLIVGVLYGDAYAGAATPLRWLMPGIFCISLAAVFLTYFASRTLPWAVVAAPLVALALNVALNLTFIPRYGIVAAAVSSTVCYALMAALLGVRFATERGTSAGVERAAGFKQGCR